MVIIRLTKNILRFNISIENAEDLQNYFKEHAPKMRGDGMQRFSGRFIATRRIFEVESVIEANKYANHV